MRAYLPGSHLTAASLAGLLALCVLASPAVAQEMRPIQVPTSPVTSALRTATALIKQGQIPAAIELLEPLLEQYPGESRVIRTLGEAYQRTEGYDQAIALYRNEINRSGGRTTEFWSLIINAQQRADRCTDAVDTLLEIFEREPAWLARFRDPLELVVTDSTCGRSALVYLEQRAGEKSCPPAWREALGNVYVVLEQDQKAVEIYTELDRQRPDRGQAIYNLARTLSRRGKIEAAVAAYDSVLSVSNTRQTLEPALFEKAGLIELLGRHQEAAALYTQMTEQYPHTPLSMRAELARAGLYLGPLGDVETAQAAYRTVLADLDSRSGNRAFKTIREEARLALAECAMRTGQFGEADSIYTRLVIESGSLGTKERCAFELGQLRFFQGDFAGAETAYYELTDDFPQGEWVNDALAQALLIGEFGMRAPGALTRFAQALYERRRGELGAAEKICSESLADSTLVLLRDHLRMLQMQLAGDQDRWSEADSLLTVLLDQDPDTRVAARALLWMGARAEADPLKADEAREYYEEVILRYPDSFETRQARDRLQVLRRRSEDS